MKQVTVTTIKHSLLQTGQSWTDTDNESIFAGWALPSHFDVLLHNSEARWGWWNDWATKLRGRSIFFCYPFYPQKYSARPEEESSDAELTDQTALPRPPESFSTMSLELKAARSSVHLLPRPQITLWLIKPWSEGEEARNTWEDLAPLTFPL